MLRIFGLFFWDSNVIRWPWPQLGTQSMASSLSLSPPKHSIASQELRELVELLLRRDSWSRLFHVSGLKAHRLKARALWSRSFEKLPTQDLKTGVRKRWPEKLHFDLVAFLEISHSGHEQSGAMATLVALPGGTWIFSCVFPFHDDKLKHSQVLGAAAQVPNPVCMSLGPRASSKCSKQTWPGSSWPPPTG